jgi:hypothetical protein
LLLRAPNKTPRSISNKLDNKPSLGMPDGY